MFSKIVETWFEIGRIGEPELLSLICQDPSFFLIVFLTFGANENLSLEFSKLVPMKRVHSFLKGIQFTGC